MAAYYFTYIKFPVGWLEIKVSDNYLLSISFALVPGDNSIHLPSVARETTIQLMEYFNGERREFSVPMFPSGTTFQLRTWDELMKIPFGHSITYHQLALKLGNEKTIRAAGHAIGQNPIPIIIPCHRVIGKDGRLTGYSGGLKNKKWLLDHEANISGNRLSLF